MNGWLEPEAVWENRRETDVFVSRLPVLWMRMRKKLHLGPGMWYTGQKEANEETL